MILKILMTVEIPQASYIDEILTVPVVLQPQVPTILSFLKNGDFCWTHLQQVLSSSSLLFAQSRHSKD